MPVYHRHGTCRNVDKNITTTQLGNTKATICITPLHPHRARWTEDIKQDIEDLNWHGRPTGRLHPLHPRQVLPVPSPSSSMEPNLQAAAAMNSRPPPWTAPPRRSTRCWGPVDRFVAEAAQFVVKRMGRGVGDLVERRCSPLVRSNTAWILSLLAPASPAWAPPPPPSRPSPRLPVDGAQAPLARILRLYKAEMRWKTVRATYERAEEMDPNQRRGIGKRTPKLYHRWKEDTFCKE
jgi:hypothetical protein